MLVYSLLYNVLGSQWPVLLVLLSGMVASVTLKKLTPAGAMLGGIIGFVIFLSAGYTGLLMMATFFIVGTAATAWRKVEKIKEGLAAPHESRRTAGQVAANAGMAGLIGLWMLLQDNAVAVGNVMIAAVFASATADTVSSELGNVYGKRFYNIITFKKDAKGLNGVVSLEGTLAGLAGSLLIAMLFVAGYGWQTFHFLIILIAGTMGNLFDSLLGATFERKGKLNNNAVNFLNTVVAAGVAFLLYGIAVTYILK